MRIVIATPIYPPEVGGPATYTVELCERLKDIHKLTVVAYTEAREPIEGTELVAVSKRRPLPVRLIKFFLATWRASQDADLIYVQNAMAAGLPVMIVSTLRRKPYILKFVGDEAWERASQYHLTEKRLEEFLQAPEGGLKIDLMRWLQGIVLRRASLVTTPSQYLGEEIKKAYHLKPERVAVNYNAAEETETPPFEATPRKHQIVATARLVVWKGIDGLIKATALLREKFPDVKLVIAGDGPETENLKKITHDLNVDSNVEFLGKISRAETWQVRKSSEVYVLNSTYEGLPHTVLTSFAARIPVVATNIGGTNEAVYNEKTGLLVEPDDSVGLAAAIERFFNDPSLALRCVDDAQKLLQEKFSWESHLQTLDGFFKTVVTEPFHKS